MLEYPENNDEVQLSPMIEMIINEDDEKQLNNRNYQMKPQRYNQKKRIAELIRVDEEEHERIKCDKILDEIEKIMKIKKYLADQDYYERPLPSKRIN